ncbi:MAG: Flp pilus assembly protein CpaB [Vampirovibrionales bacterium]|nr:Flp pilus assembly protein CpaB [Vampirovibrionales bacterium]
MSNFPIKTGHLFIGAAIVLGLITMVMFGLMGKPSDEKPGKTLAKVETQPVVVPSIPILKGETLTQDKLRVVKWPSDFLPQGATYQTIAPLLGRTPLQDLMPGEPIFSQKISSPDTNGMPALIPPGMRALTIAVSEVKGVAGFIKPGDKVDVLCTFTLSGTRDDGSRNKYYRTVTLVQDATVLASAQTMVEDKQVDLDTPAGVNNGEARTVEGVSDDKDEAPSANVKSRRKDGESETSEAKKEKSPAELEKEQKAAKKAQEEAEKKARLVSSVTLALSPVQAQQVTLAEEAGTLRLAMRSAGDLRTEPIIGSESEDVLYFNKRNNVRTSRPARRSAPPPTPSLPMVSAGQTVELIEGTEKTSVQF